MPSSTIQLSKELQNKIEFMAEQMYQDGYPGELSKALDDVARDLVGWYIIEEEPYGSNAIRTRLLHAVREELEYEFNQLDGSDDEEDTEFLTLSEAPYQLSDNQKRFVKDAEKEGKEVDFTYSGRFMYGEQCPSVRLDRGERFNTRAKVTEDSLGLGTVVYAKE